ncbi:hypothetical protein [Endozoicomonas sp. 4G]|uniref:hypothetical protein n=1 Tax=Endozoicomonas sp. 4G TaxID=2872754 RepID=UPI0020784FA7|nr:hypothetical protein [Endozoicomonas sp. 4G]
MTAVTEQRLTSLFSNLGKDYQRWKNLTQTRIKSLPADFRHYSSLIASNCEAIHTGSRSIKAFHKSIDDYLDNRVLCQDWLDHFIVWHSYFASHYNKSIPVVLVPDWRAQKEGASKSTPSDVNDGYLHSKVAYLFNANYDFRRFDSLYNGPDRELIVVTDRPGYQLKRIRWRPWLNGIFLPEHRKLFWSEHTPCDPVAGGCRFKNFSGCAEQVTPYLLSHSDTGRQFLIFNRGETAVVWHLGAPWLSRNKVVLKETRNYQFELDLAKAFDLEN